MMTSDPVSAYAQVSAANEQDVDSTPDNGNPFTPNEDDEAAAPLNGGTSGSCDISVGFAYPFCDNNGTPNDDTDDLFYFVIGATGVNTSPSWTAEFQGQNFSGPYNASLQLGSFPFPSGNQTFTIADSADPSCTASTTVQPPVFGTCSGGGGGLACTDNLLQNGGFENGLSNWDIAFGETSQVSIVSDAHSGSSALRLDAINILEPVVLEQEMAIPDPNSEYVISFFGKRIPLALPENPADGYIRLFFKDAGGNNLDFLTVNQVLALDFSEYALQFTCPPNTTSIVVEINLFSSGSFGSGSIIVDDFCLQQIGGQTCNIAVNVTNVECDDAGTSDPLDDLFHVTLEVTGSSGSWQSDIVATNENGQLPPSTIGGTNGIPVTVTFHIAQILQFVGDKVYIAVHDTNIFPCFDTITVPVPQPCSFFGIPDLVLQAPYNSPTTGVQGQSLSGIQMNVGNFGVVPAQVDVSFFLSQDAVYNNNDLFLSTSSYGSLDGGQSTNISATTQVPANVSLGDQYLLYVVDAFNDIPELDETNNVFAFPINIISGTTGQDIDLELSLVQSIASPPQWSNYSVVATLNNVGNITATGVEVYIPNPNGVVYTGGNEYDASQGTFLLSNSVWTVGDIPPNGTATLTINYFLLQNGAPNVYAEVIAANEADIDSTPGNGTPPNPNEDDEASTGSSPPPDLEPDLQLENLVIPNPTVEAGQVLPYYFDIKNAGNGSASEDFVVRAYISTDNVISPDDIQDGIVPTGKLWCRAGGRRHTGRINDCQYFFQRTLLFNFKSGC